MAERDRHRQAPPRRPLVPVGVRQPSRPSRAGFSFAERHRLSGPGLRAFLAIAGRWELTGEERRSLLGRPSRLILHTWAKAALAHRTLALNADVLLRLSAVLGIYAGLRMLFTTDADVVGWLRRPHGAVPFRSRPPLRLMLGGGIDGLLATRRFLDVALTGRYMEPNAVDNDFAPYSSRNIEHPR